ncbi:hypothetical protein JW935_11845 [candidate division KSB1 bacterium]|nr:hypothetical protein [candidate division KSB1 bacterium]
MGRLRLSRFYGSVYYANNGIPLAVGRKSKGKDFTSSWGQGLPHVKEHWIYLKLPFPLQSGKSYSLELNYPLAQNATKWDFIYDEKYTRSETIHVNQTGTIII